MIQKTTQAHENPEKILGVLLTRVTVDEIFDRFTVQNWSFRQIAKNLGLRMNLVEVAIRCKVVEMRRSTRLTGPFGPSPLQSEGVAMMRLRPRTPPAA